MLFKTDPVFLTVILVVIVGSFAPPTLAVQPGKSPVKVFILAGQSNMQGQGITGISKETKDKPGTLMAMLGDPANIPLTRHLRNDKGEWVEQKDVWVYDINEFGTRKGNLGLGFGWNLGDKDWFGPELQFGHVVKAELPNQVLIIKTAWGGKSLYTDFRPPSSGGTVGPYYKLMIQTVRKVLGNLKQEFPEYDGGGYELAGFVWWHGWNDYCDPKDAVPQYEKNLTNLVKDIRRDLKSPALPIVIGEFTGPWGADCPEAAAQTIRTAQAAVAARPEFKGTVTFVQTHSFVRSQKDSPTDETYHEFKNGETYFRIGNALGRGMIAQWKTGTSFLAEPQPIQMSGYLIVGTEDVPADYNAGYSVYAAAWPLLQRYPGHRFQTGLLGTWMFAQFKDRKAPEDFYTDIEGGLGWWNDTRFPTRTPKFIMGGVAVNFKEIANGPAHGAGSWDKPAGLYGVAQLSNRLLFPIDGLNIKQGMFGELFGYGYLPLPLTKPKPTTGGKKIPTGDNSWTLFLNTQGFKGPVCFFTPYFWSHSAEVQPNYAGLLLDSRPSDPNKSFQMETQYIPAVTSTVEGGQTFARVAPTFFPIGPDGNSIVVHRPTSYNKKALWDGVKTWFEGGPAVSGAFDSSGAVLQKLRPEGQSTWRIYDEKVQENQRFNLAWDSFAKPYTPDPTTYGYQWTESLVKKVKTPLGIHVELPEYYHLVENGKSKQWTVVKPADVPASTGLVDVHFNRPKEGPPEPYDTPETPGSPFKKPGPVAGPLQAHLGDGSVVTYYWYRFADQPALLNADLTKKDREEMQAKIEKLHRSWPIDRDYIAPPTVGKLAELDPAQIVTPPKGFEIGYVPIATRQEVDKAGPDK